MLLGIVRTDPVRAVGRSVGLLASLGASFVVAVVVANVDTTTPSGRGVIVAVSALMLIAFTVVPAITGARDAVDPLRFRQFPLGQRDAAVGLLAAGALSWPMLCLLIVAIGAAVGLGSTTGAATAAVISVVLVVVQATAFGRVAVSATTLRTETRWTRAAQWGIAIVLAALAAVAVPLLMVGMRGGSGAAGIGAVLGWTPWGSAAAFTASVEAGHAGAAVGQLIESLAVTAALLATWWVQAGRALEATPPSPTGTRLQIGGLFRMVGRTSVGAIAARSFVYWGRDPRYRASYLVLLVVPIVVIPLGVAGMPWRFAALVPLPVMALIAGFLPHNDVALDGTALWMHVAAGVRGWADRLGRIMPMLVVGLPGVVVGALVVAGLWAPSGTLAPELAASICLLLTGTGLSSVASALLPYPAVRPGDRPFQQPQSLGSHAVLAQVLTLAPTLALSAPTIVLGVIAIVTRDPATAAHALLVGIGTGVLVLVLGVLGGGWAFDRRGPALLQAVQRF